MEPNNIETNKQHNTTNNTTRKTKNSGIGPLFFSVTFSYFTSKDAPIYLPQAPFYMGAFLVLIALIVAFFLPNDAPAYDKREDNTLSNRSQSLEV